MAGELIALGTLGIIIWIVEFVVLWLGIKGLSGPIGGKSIGWKRSLAMSGIIWLISIMVWYVMVLWYIQTVALMLGEAFAGFFGALFPG